MRPRFFALLLFVLVATSSLCAQGQSLHLCIVQTKPNEETQYAPFAAGSLSVEVYNALSGKNLRNGSPLRITVLAASVQRDILPEVRRLQCEWVVQLWYADANSMFFSLWNGATREVLTRGSALLRLTGQTHLSSPLARPPDPGAITAQQVLKRLNELH
jgi:hypothetical protein